MTDDQISTLLAHYPSTVVVPVQWGDMDAFGHVNNTVFLRWFEIGRIDYLGRIGMGHGAGVPGSAPILAAVDCSFRKQVTFPDRVGVGTRAVRVGTSSLRLEHAVVGMAAGGIVAEGTSTVVHFDYGAGVSRAIPDTLRNEIALLEATSSSSPTGVEQIHD